MADEGNVLVNHASKNSTKDSSTTVFQLKRTINLWHGVGIIVGIMVGSGIFISPKGVAAACGSVGFSLIIWLVAGLLSLIGAHSYTELGCMLPKSGGDYEYIMEAFGNVWGFLYVWIMVIVVIPASNAIAALTFANYIIEPLFPCNTPSSAIVILGILAVFILMALNVWSVRASARVQTGFSAAKVAALLFVVALGIYSASKGHMKHYSHPFKNTNLQAKNIVEALYQGLYCYAGWNYLNFMAEEIAAPTKNLPRAIWIAMFIVITVFMAVNLSYFTILSPQDMANSKAVAVTFAERIFGPFGYVISFCVAMSTFGFVNGVMMTTSRIIFAAARNNHMPSVLALINVTHCTPFVSLFLISLITAICIAIQDLNFLINVTGFTEYLTIWMSVIGLLTMRKTHRHLKRPIKVNIAFPIIFTVVCVFILVVSIVTLPKECGVSIAILLVGAIIYALVVRRTYSKLTTISAKITATVQLATNSAFQDPED